MERYPHEREIMLKSPRNKNGIIYKGKVVVTRNWKIITSINLQVTDEICNIIGKKSVLRVQSWPFQRMLLSMENLSHMANIGFSYCKWHLPIKEH